MNIMLKETICHYLKWIMLSFTLKSLIVFSLHCLIGELITNGQLCTSLWLYLINAQVCYTDFQYNCKKKVEHFCSPQLNSHIWNNLRQNYRRNMFFVSVNFSFQRKRAGQLWKCVWIPLTHDKTITSLQRKFMCMSYLVAPKLSNTHQWVN